MVGDRRDHDRGGGLLAITVAVYFYLASQNANWPPLDTAPPEILTGTVNLVLFLVSLAPNFWLKRVAGSATYRKPAGHFTS